MLWLFFRAFKDRKLVVVAERFEPKIWNLNHVPAMRYFKHLLPAVIAIFAFPLVAHCAPSEADVKKVVETFYREYMRFFNKPAKGDGDTQLIAWVNASPYTSAGFKAVLKKTLVAARKRDPEVGLDADPILAGQDYPKKGYRAKTIHIAQDKASVTMEGIGPDSFHISVEMINVQGQWLINGIADIKAEAK